MFRVKETEAKFKMASTHQAAWDLMTGLLCRDPSWPALDLSITNKVLSSWFHFSLSDRDYKSSRAHDLGSPPLLRKPSFVVEFPGSLVEGKSTSAGPWVRALWVTSRPSAFTCTSTVSLTMTVATKAAAPAVAASFSCCLNLALPFFKE